MWWPRLLRSLECKLPMILHEPFLHCVKYRTIHFCEIDEICAGQYHCNATKIIMHFGNETWSFRWLNEAIFLDCSDGFRWRMATARSCYSSVSAVVWSKYGVEGFAHNLRNLYVRMFAFRAGTFCFSRILWDVTFLRWGKNPIIQFAYPVFKQPIKSCSFKLGEPLQENLAVG